MHRLDVGTACALVLRHLQRVHEAMEMRRRARPSQRLLFEPVGAVLVRLVTGGGQRRLRRPSASLASATVWSGCCRV
jgi:hypothetical protein